MKLPLNLLKKFIDLPSTDITELRHLFDDLGLEVKDVESGDSGEVFNIETLANRGDHLYVLGIARELSARLLAAVKQPALAAALPERPISLPIKRNTDLCMRYAGLEVHNVDQLQARKDLSNFLGETGGHHPLVDILNYVTLEVGQPMHAFDRDKLEGEIVIEVSTQEEKILALDQKEYIVPKGSLLIKDKKKILAVAGVIGCDSSKVTEQTKRALIESAVFDAVTIRKTAKAMKISTDASYAFERGVDYEGAISGLKRLMHLVAAVGVASKDPSSVQVTGYTLNEGKMNLPRSINIELAQLRKQLNLARLDAVEVIARLKYLGFAVQSDADNKAFKLQVPTWREWDIFNSDDIVEEVARSFSFSKVKLDLPALVYDLPETNNIERLLECVEKSMLGAGFLEVITKGFYSQSEVGVIKELDAKLADNHLALKNAVDSNYSHLKVTNILHFANLAEFNHRKGILSVKIYELCRLFSKSPLKDSTYEFEKDVFTFALSGRWNEHEWQKPEGKEQLLSMFKGVVESVIKSVGQKLIVAESKEPLLHPGCQAAIKIGRSTIGYFGLIHPLFKQKLELKNEMFYCELDAEKLSKHIQSNQFTEPSEFPSIKRDITLKIAQGQQAQKIIDIIGAANYSNLSQIVIFDNFKKNEEDFRRVTFRLTFQSNERTLENAAVDQAMQDLLTVLNTEHNIAMI